jgi:hypothetical protein
MALAVAQAQNKELNECNSIRTVARHWTQSSSTIETQVPLNCKQVS